MDLAVLELVCLVWWEKMSWRRTMRLPSLEPVAVLVAAAAFAVVSASGPVYASALKPPSVAVHVLLFVAARGDAFAVAASELAGEV